MPDLGLNPLADALRASLDDPCTLERVIADCENALEKGLGYGRGVLRDALVLAARRLIELGLARSERSVWAAIRMAAFLGQDGDLCWLLEFLAQRQSREVRQVALQAISSVSNRGPQPCLPHLAPLRQRVSELTQIFCHPELIRIPSVAAIGMEAIVAGVALGLPVPPEAFEGAPFLQLQLERALASLRRDWPDSHGLYPRCPECGGMVVLTARPGRTREVSTGVHARVPDDFLIPTCIDCGEESMAPEISAALDSLLESIPRGRLTTMEIAEIGRQVHEDFARVLSEVTAEGEALDRASEERACHAKK